MHVSAFDNFLAFLLPLCPLWLHAWFEGNFLAHSWASCLVCHFRAVPAHVSFLDPKSFVCISGRLVHFLILSFGSFSKLLWKPGMIDTANPPRVNIVPYSPSHWLLQPKKRIDQKLSQNFAGNLWVLLPLAGETVEGYRFQICTNAVDTRVLYLPRPFFLNIHMEDGGQRRGKDSCEHRHLVLVWKLVVMADAAHNRMCEQRCIRKGPFTPEASQIAMRLWWSRWPRASSKIVSRPNRESRVCSSMGAHMINRCPTGSLLVKGRSMDDSRYQIVARSACLLATRDAILMKLSNVSSVVQSGVLPNLSA